MLIEQIKEGLQYSIESSFDRRENNSYLKSLPHRISLIYNFSGLGCSERLNDSPVSYEIEFDFHLEYLKSYSPKFDIGQFPDIQEQEVCCNTQMLLHEIINCNLQGAFKKMFMESKALSLLLCFQKCGAANQADCTETCMFLTRPIEKEKILKAREIILGRLSDPPTISEISFIVGTNQCYLKKGFKELFGVTVYDFIQEQRMLQAKMLLTTTDSTVSQVADRIGFSSLSNFSSAFKKYSGVSPSELKKN